MGPVGLSGCGVVVIMVQGSNHGTGRGKAGADGVQRLKPLVEAGAGVVVRKAD